MIINLARNLRVVTPSNVGIAEVSDKIGKSLFKFVFYQTPLQDRQRKLCNVTDTIHETSIEKR